MRYLLLSLLFFTSGLFAQKVPVSGKISDEQGKGVAFVSVYVKGSTQGTTANEEGQYSLSLAPGTYELVFQHLGYELQIKQIEIKKSALQLDLQLKPVQYQLEEILVQPDGKDPAYRIIKAAIKKRKYYQQQVKSFSCDVYIKGIQRLDEYPEKIMGVEVDPKGLIDQETGIVYLSESVSKLYYEQPDNLKEEMISSKVSGDNRAFSYNQATDMVIDVYDNVIKAEGVHDRGLISPIASNALISYRYKLMGSFIENDRLIYKILVIPKRKGDPCFNGMLYIVDEDWRVHSVDFLLTKKESGINFVDSLFIKQSHLPVTPDVWMPFSNQFTFTYSMMGFKGRGYYAGVNSNYKVNVNYEKKFFNNELQKVAADANEKDSSYWEEIRPIPLTAVERKDYIKKDSIHQVITSVEYLDSTDREMNRFKYGNLLFGYTYTKSEKRKALHISSLLEDISFNTVQGWNTGLRLRYYHWPETTRRAKWSYTTNIRYGFADRTILLSGETFHAYDPKKLATIRFKGGRNYFQLNQAEPVSIIVNDLYALYEERNYMKLFQKDFFRVEHQIEVVNGIMLNSALEYASRKALVNQSDYAFNDRPYRHFSSNDPLNSNNTEIAFQKHNIFLFSLQARVRFKQKYITRPDRKIIVGSKYPRFVLRYEKAIPEVLNSNINYDLVSGYVRDRIRMKIFGEGWYRFLAGKFLNAQNMELIDFHHFYGNQTIFSGFKRTQFQLLDYYHYSTQNYFLEAYYEHHFKGFIMNKLPLIRKLKLQSIAAARWMKTDVINYSELAFGVQRWFVRVDAVRSFSDLFPPQTGVRLGLTIDLRNR